MKKNFWHVILGVLLYVTGLAQADQDNYFARHYLFQERLAKGLVFDIIQDKFGFLWFGTEYGLIRYDGHHQEVYQNEPSNPGSLAGNVITAIAEDSLGNLWVGTMYSGVHYFDRSTGIFHRYQYDPKNETTIGNNKINHITVTREGSVWIACEDGGLQLYQPTHKNFRRFHQPNIIGSNPSTLYEDRSGTLWLGTYFGLSKWDPQDSVFIEYAFIRDEGQHLRSIVEDGNQRLWTGFQNGGVKFLDREDVTLAPPSTVPAWPTEPQKNHIWELFVASDQHLWVATDNGLFLLEQNQHDLPFEQSTYHLSQEKRYLSICESSDGVFWIGTNNGVVVLMPRQKLFDHFSLLKKGESLEDERGVIGLTGNNEDQIWVGTNKGLFQFDKKERRIHQDFLATHPLLSKFDGTRFAAIYLDRQKRLWLALIEGFDANFGLYSYHLDTKELINFSERSVLFTSYATLNITEDHTGDLWFGNNGGLIRYLSKSDTLQLFQHDPSQPESLSSNRINYLLFSGTDSLWIATNEAGLALYSTSSNQLFNASTLFPDTAQDFNRRIITMLEDQAGIWLGTAGGLIYYNPVHKSVRAYDKSDGLADNVIKILYTQGDEVWVGSKSALSRYNKTNGTFTNFTASDGLQVDEFWERAGYQDEAGYLYFGGDDGLQIFHPDNIQDNPFHPRVVFTKFFLFNEEIKPRSDSKILSAPLYQSPVLKLSHNQNVFTIHFAALSFINSQKNQYAIMMEGFEEDWRYIDQKTEATYTNLDPGTYYFRVKATNNDGIWSDHQAGLTLIILPPWYGTWWAYLLYFIGLTSAVYLLYRFQLNRQLAEAETNRLRELNAVKTQLYTNITHEFRTPLTLIQGPVEKALDTDDTPLKRIDLERIRQNCRRLLHLIRQMLNLSKLEAGALTPAYTFGNVLTTIKYIIDSFSSFASSQGIDLQLYAPDDPVSMDYDPEKLADVLSNLVSNAIKFTPPGGKVGVEVTTSAHPVSTLLIKVKDTGTGIPLEALGKIFDRFYQVKRHPAKNHEESVSSGSGIGLALSKKLVELMQGSITVESTEGKGSTFTLELPIHTAKKGVSEHVNLPEVYVPQKLAHSEIETISKHQDTPDGPTILIVEDNADLAHFVAQSLPKQFQVHICEHGADGLDWATEHIPDLVISDVMMPQMNGYELTRQLKSEQKTSHIPIILLTAKADLPSKITGFEYGADAYMPKPFNNRELVIRIENLLETRQRLQQHYLQESGIKSIDPVKAQISSQENIFLKKVRNLIEANLESGDYSIEDLAGDLFMSSAQLYRKMMALTGLSPSKFFRSIQISQAKQLLLDSSFSISEVAYKTGFNDPAYFSRVFTTEIGNNPTTYREQHQQ